MDTFLTVVHSLRTLKKKEFSCTGLAAFVLVFGSACAPKPGSKKTISTAAPVEAPKNQPAPAKDKNLPQPQAPAIPSPKEIDGADQNFRTEFGSSTVVKSPAAPQSASQVTPPQPMPSQPTPPQQAPSSSPQATPSQPQVSTETVPVPPLPPIPEPGAPPVPPPPPLEPPKPEARPQTPQPTPVASQPPLPNPAPAKTTVEEKGQIESEEVTPPVQPPISSPAPKRPPQVMKPTEPFPSHPGRRVTVFPQLPEGWVPVDWENRVSEGRMWSRMALGIIRSKTPAFYRGTSDMKMFCPNYFNLRTEQKENVWVALISGIAYWESKYSPTDRFEEPGKRTDSVTGDSVHSEGLLQLSYQDSASFPQYCSDIQWEKDQNLHEKDPRKTIFDPHINLKCGIQVLHHIIKRTGRIAIPRSEGAYWSVIVPNAQSKYSRLNKIVQMVNELPFCQ